jgi:uncharacterized protein YqgC (DUF456 family)
VIRVTLTDALVGIAILVGIAGVVVPVLPGTALVLGAVLVWALEVGTTAGWLVFTVAATLLVVGGVAKYLLPGRRLRRVVPSTTLWVGALFAVVGFFVVPVVGAFVGFPLGVYVAERGRVGGAAAGASTRQALAAIGWSIFIEFSAAVLAAGVWLVGVAAT